MIAHVLHHLSNHTITILVDNVDSSSSAKTAAKNSNSALAVFL